MADPGSVGAAATLADVPPDVADSASAADPLNLQAYALIDDIINAVNEYCADGFDSLDSIPYRTLTSELGLRPGEAQELLQGTAELYAQLQSRTEEELAHFEDYALQVALRIPPGFILNQEIEPPEDSGADEAAEQVLDTDLDTLRADIGALRRTMRQHRSELTMLDRDLASCGDVGEMVAVADAVAGKASVADDAAAIAACALKLQPLLAKAARLRRSTQEAAGPIASLNVVAQADKAILRLEKVGKGGGHRLSRLQKSS